MFDHAQSLGMAMQTSYDRNKIAQLEKRVADLEEAVNHLVKMCTDNIDFLPKETNNA